MGKTEGKTSVYLETTIISYLTSRLSRDLIVAGHQQITQSWWQNKRSDFNLLVSESVKAEIGDGDPEESKKRLERIDGIPSLELNREVLAVAKALVVRGIVPEKAQADALHIGFTAVNGVDCLLTWNCKHIANVHIEKKVAKVLGELGYESPLICTPLELMGE